MQRPETRRSSAGASVHAVDGDFLLYTIGLTLIVLLVTFL
jgi:hypothetical protein